MLCEASDDEHHIRIVEYRFDDGSTLPYVELHETHDGSRPGRVVSLSAIVPLAQNVRDAELWQIGNRETRPADANGCGCLYAEGHPGHTGNVTAGRRRQRRKGPDCSEPFVFPALTAWIARRMCCVMGHWTTTSGALHIVPHPDDHMMRRVELLLSREPHGNLCHITRDRFGVHLRVDADIKNIRGGAWAAPLRSVLTDLALAGFAAHGEIRWHDEDGEAGVVTGMQ